MEYNTAKIVTNSPYEFSLDRDLDPFAHVKFNIVADNGELYGVLKNPSNKGRIVHFPLAKDLEVIEGCLEILDITSSASSAPKGIFRYDSGIYVLNLAAIQVINLKSPPSSLAIPSCLSARGRIGGSVNYKEDLRPAIWEEDGALLTSITSKGKILRASQNAGDFYIGYLENRPAIWVDCLPICLEIPNGFSGTPQSVNSKGTVGGYITNAEGTKDFAVLWTLDGKISDLSNKFPLARSSKVQFLTEDGCAMVETINAINGVKSFFYGRSEDLTPLENLLPKDIATLYIGSIDAVSSMGRVLLSCSPNSLSSNSAQVVLIPRSLKSQGSDVIEN